MPWTYPPQMGLFTQALSLLPVGLGYALFTGLGLAALLWTLFRLAPQTAAPALMLTLPASLMNIRAGQNGFLIALLFALTFLFLLRQRRLAAGVSLGLLAVKPHLGLGLGLVALVRGGAVMVATAIVVLALSLGLATWALGAEIWPAFLQSVRDSSTFLKAGAYPMERMISIHALLSSMGVSSGISFLVQSVMALVSLGLIALALLRRWRLDNLLALSGTAGLAVSPYGYDYDLVALTPRWRWACPRSHVKPAARSAPS
ncbi:MAG: glycosyltransferase family 87 protein [Paracoccaceae bacterium]